MEDNLNFVMTNFAKKNYQMQIISSNELLRSLYLYYFTKPDPYLIFECLSLTLFTNNSFGN